MPFNQDDIERFSTEFERATQVAKELADKYLALHHADDGSLTRDPQLLPDEKENIRHALIVVGCVADSRPDAVEFGKTVFSAWVSLEFFQETEPRDDQGASVALRLVHGAECAGNAKAKAEIQRQKCLSPYAENSKSLLEAS